MRKAPALFLIATLLLLTEAKPIHQSRSYRKVNDLVDKVKGDVQRDLNVINRQNNATRKLHQSYLRHERNYKTLKTRYDRLYRHYYNLIRHTTRKKASVDEIRKQLLQELNLLDNIKGMLSSYSKYAQRYERLKRHYAKLNCTAN